MTPLLPVGVRIFVASESIDGRRSFDGLAAIVKETLKKNPLAGDLYVFRNRTAKRMKALLWDRTGWILYADIGIKNLIRLSGLCRAHRLRGPVGNRDEESISRVRHNKGRTTTNEYGHSHKHLDVRYEVFAHCSVEHF